MTQPTTLSLSLPTASGTAYYRVTATVTGSDVQVTDVAATDMAFRTRLARASYESELRAHLAELGRDWSEVVDALVAKARRAA